MPNNIEHPAPCKSPAVSALASSDVSSVEYFQFIVISMHCPVDNNNASSDEEREIACGYSQTDNDLDMIVKDWITRADQHSKVIVACKTEDDTSKPRNNPGDLWSRVHEDSPAEKGQDERNLERRSRILQPLYQITEYLR